MPEEKSNPVIIRFYDPDEENGFLSNYFEYRPFFLDGLPWVSVEHFYQAAKFEETQTIHKGRIWQANSPDAAKSYARSHKHSWRPGWEIIKYPVMKRAVWAKFCSSGFLRQWLLETGDAILVEDSPNDAYWGQNRDGIGLNLLGQVLMSTRAELFA